jgi:DNA primase
MGRAPDGIHGERVFQRHALAGVSAVEPITVIAGKNPYHLLASAPELAFDRVIEAAHEMREVLLLCGLEAFMSSPPSRARRKVHLYGQRRKPLHLRLPKIFIDYLRNDRTATAVAPWSTRAREGAPVAIPMFWKEVREGLDPAAFTIAKVKSILKRADPWKDLASSAASLDAATKKLAQLG